MISLHTLVFATDDSASAKRARPVAERLAAQTGADLHILRVEIVPVLSHVEFRASPTLDTIGLSATDIAAGIAADLHLPTPPDAPGGRTVEAVRRWPHVGEAILHYAADVGAGLVVMGTHGYGGVNRLVMGSTAEYVLRRSLCAVLTVGAEADVDARGPVLCPLDFSARSAEALAVAADLASARGVALHVLHAVEPVVVPSPYGGLVFPPDDAERVERAREEIGRIVAGAGLPPVATTVSVHVGYPEHEILAAAAGAGLVVQASHGRKGAARLFLGSVAEAVVREAPCAVLTVKASGVALHRPDADALDRAAPVPRALWADTLDNFSKQVRDSEAAQGRWTVGVDVVSPELEPGVVMAHQPFVGASYDAHADRIDVLTEGGSHRIEHPLAVRALDTDGGARLDVVRRDGARERITVRPARGA